MSNEKDIESLLADILNDDKPLPSVNKTLTNVVANSGAQALDRAAELASSDDDWLNELMAEAQPATPMQVAQAVEINAELVMADSVPITQCVTPTEADPDNWATQEAVFTDTESRTDLAAIKMPTFTAADFASTMDIRNFATLVTLNTARWHAKVKDRQAARDAATMSNADEGSFEARKRLLVGADDQLKKIHRTIDDARAAHYRMTLPWSTTSLADNGRRTGGRLLPNTLFVEYTTEMALKRRAMVEALDAFVPKYPELIEIAKHKLGKRFDPRDYPNTDSIRAHFDLSFDFQPIPKGDDFAGLPQAQLDALANKVNDNTRMMAEHALQDVWARMHEYVSRMAERLSSPDKLFHNTLVQNVKETARLVAHLNITKDPRIESIRKKIDKHLCQYEPKDLRENPVLRTNVAGHALSIIEEMNQ